MVPISPSDVLSTHALDYLLLLTTCAQALLRKDLARWISLAQIERISRRTSKNCSSNNLISVFIVISYLVQIAWSCLAQRVLCNPAIPRAERRCLRARLAPALPSAVSRKLSLGSSSPDIRPSCDRAAAGALFQLGSGDAHLHTGGVFPGAPCELFAFLGRSIIARQCGGGGGGGDAGAGGGSGRGTAAALGRRRRRGRTRRRTRGWRRRSNRVCRYGFWLIRTLNSDSRRLCAVASKANRTALLGSSWFAINMQMRNNGKLEKGLPNCSQCIAAAPLVIRRTSAEVCVVLEHTDCAALRVNSESRLPGTTLVSARLVRRVFWLM